MRNKRFGTPKIAVSKLASGRTVDVHTKNKKPSPGLASGITPQAIKAFKVAIKQRREQAVVG